LFIRGKFMCCVLGFIKNKKNLVLICLPCREVYPVKCEAIFNRERLYQGVICGSALVASIFRASSGPSPEEVLLHIRKS